MMRSTFKVLSVLLILVLLSVFIINCGGSSDNGDSISDNADFNGTAYTASGTYIYDSQIGILNVNVTSSNFKECGPEVGSAVFTVQFITSTIVWTQLNEDNYQITWTRDSGIDGDIVGTWEQTDEDGNSFELTLNSDGSFSIAGHMVNCEGDNENSQNSQNSYTTFKEAKLLVTDSLINGSGTGYLRLYSNGKVENGGNSVTINTGMYILFLRFSNPLFPAFSPDSIPLNYSWEITGSIERNGLIDYMPFILESSVESVSEVVNVPAGNFENCIKIVYSYNYNYYPGDEFQFPQKITRYFNKNVGIVKVVIERATQTEVVELIEYNLSGVGIVPLEVGNSWTYRSDKFLGWSDGNTETFSVIAIRDNS